MYVSILVPIQGRNLETADTFMTDINRSEWCFYKGFEEIPCTEPDA